VREGEGALSPAAGHIRYSTFNQALSFLSLVSALIPFAMLPTNSANRTVKPGSYNPGLIPDSRLPQYLQMLLMSGTNELLLLMESQSFLKKYMQNRGVESGPQSSRKRKDRKSKSYSN
jgi:hypothetical protein